MAHALAAVIGALPRFEVRLLTRQPSRWKSEVRGIYLDRAEVAGKVATASDDPSIVTGAEVVLVALPQIAVDDVLQRIKPYLARTTWIGAVPGYGGIDWRVRTILGTGQPYFGLQRVPYVRKTISYGEAVWISGIRPHLFVAAIPATTTIWAAELVEDLLGIPATALSSYLLVNLTTTNPTFHPARIYSAFSESLQLASADPAPQFYADWDEAASSVFLALDAELKSIAEALPLDTPDLVDIKRHYGVSDVQSLTTRIRNIEALRDRPIPLRNRSGTWFFDSSSAYVTEDIPFGLAPIKGIAEVAGVETPVTDEILRWADTLLDRPLFTDTGSLRTDGRFPHPAYYELDDARVLAAAARE